MAREISLREVMLRASVIMLALLISSRFVGYLFHLIFVRSFPKEVYGSFVFIWSAAMFLCGLLPNISASMSRFVAYYRGSEDRGMVSVTIRTGLTVNTLFAATMVLGLYLYYLSGLSNLDLPSIVFMMLAIFLTSTLNLLGGIITGYRRPEVAAFLSFIYTVLRVAAVAAAVAVVATLPGIMALFALSLVLALLIYAIYEHRTYGFGSSYKSSSAKEIVRFGFYNIINVTANNILTFANIFILQFFMGAAVVAVFNVSSLASTVSLLFFIASLQVFSPIVSEMFGGKKLGRIGYITSYFFESFFLLFLPIFLSVFVFAREILTLFFTSDYLGGVVPLQILSFAAFFWGMAMLFIEFTNSEGRPEVNARNLGFGAAVNVIASFVLIRAFGMEGAAAATLLSSLVVLVLSFNHVRHVVHLSYSTSRILKIILSSAVAVAAVSAVKGLTHTSIASLVLSSISLFVVYAAALLLLKSLRREDTTMVEALMEKAHAPRSIRVAASFLMGYGVAG